MIAILKFKKENHQHLLKLCEWLKEIGLIESFSVEADE